MAQGPDFAVAKHLAKLGFGTFFQDAIDANMSPEAVGTIVAAGEMPLRPDDAVVVLPGLGGRLDSVGVQEDQIFEVRSRSATYDAAYGRALAISNALHLAQGDIGGILMRISANTTPTSLGRDESRSGGRWVMSQTFTARLKQGENTV